MQALDASASARAARTSSNGVRNDGMSERGQAGDDRSERGCHAGDDRSERECHAGGDPCVATAIFCETNVSANSASPTIRTVARDPPRETASQATGDDAPVRIDHDATEILDRVPHRQQHHHPRARLQGHRLTAGKQAMRGKMTAH